MKDKLVCILARRPIVPSLWILNEAWLYRGLKEYYTIFDFNRLVPFSSCCIFSASVLKYFDSC